MRRTAAILAILTILVLAGSEPRLRSQEADAAFDRVARLVAEKMKEHQIPGVSLGIVRDGMVATRGFGVTNTDHPLPVTDGTLFQIGSITKTFTGTLLMHLVDAGRVRLDAPVRTYLPEFAVRDEAAARGATVLDLLTHMGGWEGDVFDDTGEGDDATSLYVARLKDAEQVAPLRTVWSYNNAGFIVAGRIVEVVAGKTYEAALRDMVTAPLGMNETFITPSDVMTLRFAVGHNHTAQGLEVARPWPIGRYAHAAGGVVATARDLLTFAQFHMGATADPGVLSAAALRRMHDTVLTKHGEDGEMAITWNVTKTGGLRRLEHGGATLGQQALLSIVPERRFAVAVLTNSSRGSRLHRDVLRRALKEYLGVDEGDPAPLAAQPDPTAYTGVYGRPFADVVLSVENGGLRVQTIAKRGFPNASAPVPPPGPKVRYAFYAPDRAIATDGPQKGARIAFIRAADGSLRWVRVGGRIHRRAGAGS